jgi:hypothetical protein
MSLELVMDVLRTALDHGEAIEMDGLGTFQRTPAGYGFTPETQPRVFVAYAVEDFRHVKRLCDALRSRGCAPWLDKEKLLPGQNWPRAIERAIQTSDAFIACFSPRSISKRGHFQSELRYALDCARELPLEQVFVIPVRLERCIVPREISDRVQYVDLFANWDRGVRRIARAVRRSGAARPSVEFR